MIDEEATFKKFGYYGYDLKAQSAKKIVAVCDDCGKVRFPQKSRYHALCGSCCKKGAKIKRICQTCGKEFPVTPSVIKRGHGMFCCRKRTDKYFRGENSPHWKNGASVRPYCYKWNEHFREYIRCKFGRICFLCGKTEEENGKRLSVHHCNGNKNCGCDDDETCQFIPLCKNCHAKVHSKKVDWEKKIKDKLRTKLNGWYI